LSTTNHANPLDPVKNNHCKKGKGTDNSLLKKYLASCLSLNPKGLPADGALLALDEVASDSIHQSKQLHLPPVGLLLQEQSTKHIS